MIPDGRLNIAYFFGHTVFGESQYSVLAEYDLTRFTFIGALSFPNISDRPLKILRWGSNGLAIMTDNTTTSNIYLITGDFVTSPKL